ncbi:WXG100 family type VII secretion target [Actinomycetospora sp. CA-053990]|uniref:WXG100 family type VII secretion target n=1 Tax=Actinomycetospora sp. CA-053990 TaxID=3239891 RepID=UPI003D922E4D
MSEGPTVAIDLGVTTVAASVDVSPDSRAPAETVEPAEVPLDLAAVFAPADGTALAVGAAARRLAPTDPSRYEPTPRLRVDDPDLLLGTRVVGIAEAWGAVLAGALERAGPLLRGDRPRHLVLTHPAGWDAGRREVLRRAGSGLAAGLTLLAEPVAAAAHAAWMRPQERRPGPIAVLDLGARGADASVLAPDPGRCGGARLLARRRDDRFGGDDADELLLGHLLSTLADEPTPGDASREDPAARRDADRVREVVAATTLGDRRHRQVLLDDVRAAKEQLSDAEQAAVPLPGRLTAAWLSRGELTEVLRPSLRRVVDLLAETLADAGTGPEHLDGVWLTGGGARIPLLAALVHRELGVPATVGPEPRLVVVRGALVVAREDEALLGGAAGAASRQRAGAAVAAGAGRSSSSAPRSAAGPLLDPPTVELPPGERAWPRAEPGVPDAEPTEDLGDPADTPAWLTPTSSGSPALLPVRRVDGAEGDDGSDDATAPGAAVVARPSQERSPQRRLPARRPRSAGPPRRPVGVGAVVIAALAILALVTGIVLGVRAVSRPSGTPTVVGGQVFVAPVGWVTAGGDAAARRVLLRPAGALQGTDLVAVQENPSTAPPPRTRSAPGGSWPPSTRPHAPPAIPCRATRRAPSSATARSPATARTPRRACGSTGSSCSRRRRRWSAWGAGTARTTPRRRGSSRSARRSSRPSGPPADRVRGFHQTTTTARAPSSCSIRQQHAGPVGPRTRREPRMAGQFGTETDVMLTASQRIQDIKQGMQGHMSSLQSQLAPLAGTWRGQGSVAFQGLMARWNEDATRINTALDEIAAKIGQSGRNYAASDEDNRQAFSQLGGTGGSGPAPGATTPASGGGLGQYL